MSEANTLFPIMSGEALGALRELIRCLENMEVHHWAKPRERAKLSVYLLYRSACALSSIAVAGRAP